VVGRDPGDAESIVSLVDVIANIPRRAAYYDAYQAAAELIRNALGRTIVFGRVYTLKRGNHACPIGATITTTAVPPQLTEGRRTKEAREYPHW
jgi:hypothetical protein